MNRRTYSFGQFVKDRLIYILISLACSVCIAVIAVLGIVPYKGDYRDAGIGYLFLLAVCFILAALVIDYLRQASFYRTVERRLAEDSIDALSIIAPGATREQQILKQTVELQYGKYKDLLEQYRSSEERRRLFTDQWVHQIKTPVSVIDLLTQETGFPSSIEHLNERLCSISEENERIKGYLELVLHYARLDQFENDVHVGRVPLIPLLRQVINSYKTSFIRARIYPSITGAEAIVATDEKWLIFVVNQVLSNAVKYSGLREGKQLHVHISHGPQETVLTITDEGIGIPPQDLPRVLDPFFTGENGRMTKESTGMGLYLAHEVCRKLGHPLSIESEVSVGTKVTIRFAEQSIHSL